VGWQPNPHERLKVFLQSKRLVTDLYRETAAFPIQERFGLVSQIRRAAVSVPVNIAEGAGRGSNRDFLRFLFVSRGSLNELVILLEIAKDTGCLSAERQAGYEATLKSLFAMLNGLIHSVEERRGRQESR
jgi:four helix bundle protein